MSSIEYFTYTPTELSAQLTSQSQATLGYLLNHQFITKDQYNELIDSLVVTPIQNKPSFGAKLLARFFNKQSTDDAWVFPITRIDPHVRNNVVDGPKKGKPSLEVVK